MADNQNPTPQQNFDFIMKEEPKQPRSFKAPPNIPKPVFFGGLVIIGIFLIIIVASIFSGGSGNSTEIYKLISDASVIENTSDDAINTTASTDTRNVATTTKQSMSSQEQQLKAYLKTQNIKYNSKQVRTAPDSATATKLKSSQLNNTYDQTYLSYLKTSLNTYQIDLKTTYKSAGPNLKKIINDAYSSNSVILASPQLK